MREYKVFFKKTTEKRISGKVVLIAKESTKTIIARTLQEAEAKAKRFAGWTGLKVTDIQEQGYCRGL